MPDGRRHKYREVFEHVYQGLVRGRYRPGSRIPTETELATRFGASRMTVSRALRDLQVQGLLLRRPGAGTFVQDQQRQATGTVGLIFPDFPGFHAGVFDSMTVELTQQIQAAGFGVFIGDPLHGGVDAVLQDPEKVCEPYLARKLVSVFFTPVELPPEHMEANRQILEVFKRQRIPVVLLDRDICDFPGRSRHDLVGVDNFGAAYVIVEHLLNLGHRRIHFVGTSAVAATVTVRIMGYQAALLRHGVIHESGWVHRGDPGSLEFARQLNPRSADAFLCSNDHVAALLMRHFATLGIRVPDDVAIAGFDDTPFAALLAPPLTTVRQPAASLGTVAMRAMLERLADPGIAPREIRLSCELVVRESCGARRTGDSQRDAKPPVSVPPDLTPGIATRKRKGGLR